jgi:GNAT superfamily N-acetyltransferase
MHTTNLERMIALADEFFEAKNDPDQIVVDEEVMERLRKIHPATLSEETDENGPIAWMLVIPTVHQVMEQFIRKEISERELLEVTAPTSSYDALYLCSALVLPEHRGKGLAKRLAACAIRAIMNDHPIKGLFYWAFSDEGMRLAESIAGEFRLPLYQREA